jgi:hypothetical protein
MQTTSDRIKEVANHSLDLETLHDDGAKSQYFDPYFRIYESMHVKSMRITPIFLHPTQRKTNK